MLQVSGRDALRLLPIPKGPETPPPPAKMTPTLLNLAVWIPSAGLSPHSGRQETPVQDHSCRCQLRACGMGHMGERVLR